MTHPLVCVSIFFASLLIVLLRFGSGIGVSPLFAAIIAAGGFVASIGVWVWLGRRDNDDSAGR